MADKSSRSRDPIVVALEQEREDLLYMATLADRTQRYDEMAETMKKMAKMHVQLKWIERNFFSLGCKIVVNSRLKAWRTLKTIEEEERRMGNDRRLLRVREFLEKVEGELESFCGEIVDVIDNYLIPASEDTEYLVFLHKMKGDYYRYLIECKDGEAKKDVAEMASEAYETATKCAEALLYTNPIRLGLAINFSVFLKEIMNLPERARLLAQQAFDGAISRIDDIDREDLKSEVTWLTEILQENLTKWASDNPEDAGGRCFDWWLPCFTRSSPTQHTRLDCSYLPSGGSDKPDVVDVE